MAVSSIIGQTRARYATLPAATRTAWRWDMSAGFFAGIYQGCVWTFVARVARADLHATGAQMGMMAAAPAIGYLFSTVWARQMEGRSKLPFIYWTWLVSRGIFIFTPLIATREQYIGLVCAMPIIFSISTPAYTAVMKDIYPDSFRGRLMSSVRICMNATMLLAALVAGRILDHGVDFRTVFAVGGVFGALTAWSFSRMPVTPTPRDGAPVLSTAAFFRDTVDILRRNPGYRWFSFSVFTYGFGNIVASTIYPIFQVDQFHVTNTQVANMQNLGALTTVAGFFMWGPHLDRRGPQMTVLVCLLLICLVPVCYACATTIGPLYLASALLGIAASGIDIGYLNTTLLYSEPGRAAQYQALHSTFFGIRGSIAPFCAIPLMHAAGARVTFWLSLIVMLAGTALQVAAIRSSARARTAPRRGRAS